METWILLNQAVSWQPQHIFDRFCNAETERNPIGYHKTRLNHVSPEGRLDLVLRISLSAPTMRN